MSATYCTTYASPLGPLTLTATDRGLSGIYFTDHKPAPKGAAYWIPEDGSRFAAVKTWLNQYFQGKSSSKLPPLDPPSGTDFQNKVWQALRAIKPGTTTTYGQLAEQIGHPQAVRALGAAVGRNPLSILIPCHRVLGQKGSLTGFAGGIERKKKLLELEGALR